MAPGRLTHDRPDAAVLDLVGGPLRHAFEAAVTGIALISLEGRYLLVNPALCRFLARSREELVGMGWRDLTYPDDLEPGERYAHAALERGVPSDTHEKRYLRPDGTARWAIVSVSLVQDDDGAPLCFMSQVVDIDERKRAERALQQAEEKHRALLERLPGIVYTAESGPEGRWLYVSPALETILGYKPEDWIRDPGAWLAAVHPDDYERVVQEESLGWSLGPGVNAYGEYRLVSADGRTVWVRDEAAIVEDPVQGPVWQGVIIDITHTKMLEEQVRHAHKMEALGVLAGGAAHNFNNLLAVIQNYACFALESLGEEDPAGGDIREIVMAAKRASALVRDLLAFARQDSAPGAVIDLNEVVSGMEALMRTALHSRVELETALSDGAALTRADAGHIEQVVLNLVLNARDAIDDEGRIRIETTVEDIGAPEAARRPGLVPGRYACLCVSDDGRGMTAEVKARAFEPFFTTKSKASGTGLGLASVYGLVKQWQGYVQLDSEVERGTRVKIYIPGAVGVDSARVKGGAASP
jgi:two-component system, cell cycle sensor histidine kinase and response regulator CckA